MIADSMAKKIAEAKSRGGARYPYIDNKDAVLGDFELTIEAFKQKIGEVDKHEKYIAEFLVEETSSPDKQPKGSRLQWIRTPATAKFPDQEIQEIRELIVSALPDIQLSAEDIAETYGPQNPLAGRRVKARVYKKPSGFVCVKFSPKK